MYTLKITYTIKLCEYDITVTVRPKNHLLISFFEQNENKITRDINTWSHVSHFCPLLSCPRILKPIYHIVDIQGLPSSTRLEAVQLLDVLLDLQPLQFPFTN